MTSSVVFFRHPYRPSYKESSFIGFSTGNHARSSDRHILRAHTLVLPLYVRSERPTVAADKIRPDSHFLVDSSEIVSPLFMLAYLPKPIPPQYASSSQFILLSFVRHCAKLRVSSTPERRTGCPGWASLARISTAPSAALNIMARSDRRTAEPEGRDHHHHRQHTLLFSAT